MARIAEVADKIYEIKPEGREHENFPLCTVYLVVDDRTALIEVGSSVQIPDIRQAVAKLGYEIRALSYIIPTHVHPDHAGGAGHLARRLPHAKVVAHPRAARVMADQSIINRMLQSRRVVFGDDADQRYGGMLAIEKERFLLVEDGSVIDLGERHLTAIHTPGHDPNHLCFMDSATRGLFCGDALGGYFSESNSRALACVPGSDPELIIASIDKLRNFNPELLFFSHGGASADAPRIIQVALNDERRSAEIAFKAWRNGADQKEIAGLLADILAEKSVFGAEQLLAFPYFTALSAEGYRQYFKKKRIS